MFFLPFLQLTHRRDKNEHPDHRLQTHEHFKPSRAPGTWYLEIPEDVHPYVEVLSRPIGGRDSLFCFTYYGFSAAAPCLLMGLMNKQRGLNRFASPHKFVLLVAAFVAASHSGLMLIDHRELKRRAYLKQYVMQHPERFPIVERPKYKDLLLPWVPNR